MSISYSVESSCDSSYKDGFSILPNLRFLSDEIAEIFAGDARGSVEIIEMKNYVLPNITAPPFCVFQCTEERDDEYITCVEFPGNFPYILTGNSRGEICVTRERLNCPHPFVEKRRIYTSPKNESFFVIRSNQLDAGFVSAAYPETDDRDRLVVLDLLRQGHMENSAPLVDFVTHEELIDVTWTWKHPALLLASSSAALRVIDIRCAKDCPRSLFLKGPLSMLKPSHFKPEIFCGVAGREIQLFDLRKLSVPLAKYDLEPELSNSPINMIKWHPRLPHELMYSSTRTPFIARVDTSDATTLHKVKVKGGLPKSDLMSWDRTWDFAETDQSFVDKIVQRRNEVFPVVENRTVIPGYGEQYDMCRQDETQELPQILNSPRFDTEFDSPSGSDSSSFNSLPLSNFSGIDDGFSGIDDGFSGIEFDEDSCSFPGDDHPSPDGFGCDEIGVSGEVKTFSFVRGAGIDCKPNSREMLRRASLQSVYSEPIPIQPNKYYQKYVQISESALVFQTMLVDSQYEDDEVVYETTDRTASPVISSSMSSLKLEDNSPEIQALREEKKRSIYWDPMKALRSLSVPEEVMDDAMKALNEILPAGASITVEAVNALATVAISKLRAIYMHQSILTATPSSMGVDCITGYRLKARPQSFAIPGYGLSGVAFLHPGPTARIQFVESIVSENEAKVPSEFIMTMEDIRLHELYKITPPGHFNLFEQRLRSQNTHPKDLGHSDTLHYLQSDGDPWFLLWAMGSAHYYESPIRNGPLLQRLAPPVEKKPPLPSLKEILESLPPPEPILPPPPPIRIDASLSIEEAVNMMKEAEKEQERKLEAAEKEAEAIKAAALGARAMSVSSLVETPSPPSSSSDSWSPVTSPLTSMLQIPHLPSALKPALVAMQNLEKQGWKKHRRVTFADETKSGIPLEVFDPNPMPSFYRIISDREKPIRVDSEETLPLLVAMKQGLVKTRRKKPKKRARKQYTLIRNSRFKKESRIHVKMDLEMKGFPGLLQLVDMDIKNKATRVVDFDCVSMEYLRFYTSPYRVRMLLPFRLGQRDLITHELRPDASGVHDYLEVLLCSLLHGKFIVFVQVLESIALKYAIPNTIGKVYSRSAQFFLDFVKLIRSFVKFITDTRPKAMRDSTNFYLDVSEPLLDQIDDFMAREHDFLHKEYILLLPCIWILRMEVHAKHDLEMLKDKIMVMKRIPFHFRLLFLVRTCRTKVLRSCLLQMFEKTTGMDRLMYVGLGRHTDCLSVLADHLHETQDYQMVAHLLIAGRVLEDDEHFLEVISDIVVDKPKIVYIPPPTPTEPPKLYDFNAKIPPTMLPPPEQPKEPAFEDVYDPRPPLHRSMFLRYSGWTREEVIEKYLYDGEGKARVYEFLRTKGRLPPNLHMHQVYRNKYLAGIVPGSTLLAIARSAVCRYFVYLQLVDDLVQESHPRLIEQKEPLPETFKNGGLFKYYLAKLTGTTFHSNLVEDETFVETRCQFCGATRNTAVRPVPDEEQQQQITKNQVIKDRADRRRKAMQEANDDYEEQRTEGDPDSFVPHEDINGSMATTEAEMYAPPAMACPQCRKPSGRCSLCHRMERTDFSEISDVDHTSTHFVICKNCHHGGHMDHIQDWFRRFNECPVTECLCKCFRLPKGEDVRNWIEEDMGFHPDATFEF